MLGAADALPHSMVPGEAKGKIVKEKERGMGLKTQSTFHPGPGLKSHTFLMREDLTKTITDEVPLPSLRMENMFQFKSEFSSKLLEFLLKRFKS